MRAFAIAIAGLALSAHDASAQDATGRWEGVIRAPEAPVSVIIDLSRDAAGRLSATFSRAETNIKGLPLADVSQNGRALTFTLRANNGGGTFVVELAEDLTTIAGKYNTAEGGYAIPFDAKRTGPAVVEAPIRNEALGAEFVGGWSGLLDVGAAQVPLALALTNGADHTSRGVLTLTQRPGSEIEAVMTQKGAELTLTFRMIGATFVGRLNDARTEIAGTYSGEGRSYPLVFKRNAPRP